MKNRQSMPHVFMQKQTAPVAGLMAAPRTDPLRLTVRGAVILALLFGTAGAGLAASSGYHGSGPADAHLVSVRHMSERPWMY
jgi:hypothetical protein